MAGEYDQISNALKIAYPPKAVEPMLNQEAPFRKHLKKSIPSGSRASEAILKFGANLHPPQNAGQTSDGGDLVTPQDRTQDQFTLRATMFVGGFQIGFMTRELAASNKSAFNGGELRRRVEETVEDLGKYMEQTYVAGDGTSKRAEIESDSANAFVAAHPWGVRLLNVNQFITDRTTPGGTTIVGTLDYRKITAINLSTRTVTYNGTDQSGSSAPGDDISVVVAANQGITGDGLSSINATATGLTANGIRGLVDDGTYARWIHGLDRQAVGYNKLNSIVKGNSGTLRNLTESILINAVHEVRQQTGKRVTDAWTNTGQVEKYIEFVAPDRRYTVAGNGVQGMGTGYKEDSLVHYAPGVQFKINVSVDVLPRELFLFNWETFFLYQAREVDWWDNPMLKPTPATNNYKASYVAHLYGVENIGCIMPLGNVVIRDLKDPLCGDL